MLVKLSTVHLSGKYLVELPSTVQITPSLLHQFTNMAANIKRYIILTPLKKLFPQSHINLTHLAATFLLRFASTEKITSSNSKIFPS